MLEEIVKKYCKNSNVDFISPRNRDNNLEKKMGFFSCFFAIANKWEARLTLVRHMNACERAPMFKSVFGVQQNLTTYDLVC